MTKAIELLRQGFIAGFKRAEQDGIPKTHQDVIEAIADEWLDSARVVLDANPPEGFTPRGWRKWNSKDERQTKRSRPAERW